MQTAVLLHVHGQVRDVKIAEFHSAAVDGLAQVAVGLMTKTAGNQTCTDHSTVHFIADCGTDTDGQILCVTRFHQSQRHCLGAAHAGETTDAQNHARLYELCCLLGGHHFAL